MLDVLLFLSLFKRVNVISRYFGYIHTLFHIRILHSFDLSVCKVLLSATKTHCKQNSLQTSFVTESVPWSIAQSMECAL